MAGDDAAGSGRRPRKRGGAPSVPADDPTPAQPLPAAPEGGSERPLIVAIGASAGGLNAFKTFFAHMPPDSGLGFVLVQHLDPTHKSLLAELLGRVTTMPVSEAVDGTPVVANQVFIIPPDATLTIRDARLHVERPAPPRERRWPIDAFFTSLAEDQGENAVCIVLSGTGSDGTLGLRMVKSHGGLTLAQPEDDDLAISGMPRSAAATGLVDHVLPVEDMPALLLGYRQHLAAVGAQKDDDGTRQDAADHMAPITALLRAAVGHDFSGYKPNTIVRRIQRRMQVLQIDTVPAFVERLRRDPDQLNRLFHELLIGITGFFRDPDAFEELRIKVVRGMLENKQEIDQVRVWVPGCSTGEEVYSIAILLKEEIEHRGIAPKVQIFGTDIDETAVATARAGNYPKGVPGMSAERLARWFVEDSHGYRLVKSIREMCLFSPHSLLRDPPFSRLDLISCRNLLIYMTTPLQERVLRMFHYALSSDGALFLGASEGIGRRSNLFAVLDGRHRLFRRRDTAEPTRLPELPTPFDVPARRPIGVGRTLPVRALPGAGGQPEDPIDRNARAVMEKYSPAYLVINEQHEILRFSGGEAGRYLEPTRGAASLNLFGILRKTLRPAVRAGMQKAAEARRSAVQENVAIAFDGHPHTVTVIVEPLRDAAGPPLWVVAFRDAGRILRRRSATADPGHGDAMMRNLEEELLTTRAQLQTAIDEAETAVEEAKSSAEEYQTVNEELQSSNEELETAKEEMQSINEELQTINAELSNKNEMLTSLNSDMQNLLTSTQIATIFLDHDLRIRSFTPAMTQLFHLRDADRSRPLTEIVTRMSYGHLAGDVATVLRDHRVIEREVEIADKGTTFMMRIRPYETVDRVVDGVVMTFVDITERKRTEVVLREHAAIVEFASDALIGINAAGTVRSWNPAAERLFGYSARNMIDERLSALAAPDRLDEQTALADQARAGKVAGPIETMCRRKDGSLVEVELTITPILGADKTVLALAVAARNISDRTQAEKHRMLLLHELSHRVKNALATVQSLVLETLRTAPTLDAFRQAFASRLMALSNTHSLLTRSRWEGAALRDVLEAELAPYGIAADGRWTAAGAEMRLTPKMALALGMAFHELATNAAKYGALSVPGGHVAVSWQFQQQEDGPQLHLSWVESGGPPVVTPVTKGFGSRLVADGLAFELDGHVQMAFDPAGVRCTIDVPWDKAGGLP